MSDTKHRGPRRLSAVVSLLVLAAHSSAALPDCAPTQLNPAESPIAIDPAARQRQSDALRAMSVESVEYSLHGPIKQLRGITGIVLPANIVKRKEGKSADDILPLFADILLASGTESLIVREHRDQFGSERALMLTQSIRGIPVLQGVLAIGYDTATRRVTTMTANFIPDRDLPRAPRLSAKQAEQVVPKALAIAEKVDASQIVVMDGTHLGYYADSYSPEPAQLVWVVQVGGGWEHEEYYVDAITGIVAYRRPLSLSFVGRDRPLIEVTGARCECTGKSYSPQKPMRRLSGCGRLVGLNWSQMPGVDRYVGQMARPDLGWAFSDLVIDGSSPQCACEVPRTSLVRLRGCNSCGCGPWSKGQLIEVRTPCPEPADLSAQQRRPPAFE
jgi:hypothetical protein